MLRTALSHGGTCVGKLHLLIQSVNVQGQISGGSFLKGSKKPTNFH